MIIPLWLKELKIIRSGLREDIGIPQWRINQWIVWLVNTAEVRLGRTERGVWRQPEVGSERGAGGIIAFP